MQLEIDPEHPEEVLVQHHFRLDENENPLPAIAPGEHPGWEGVSAYLNWLDEHRRVAHDIVNGVEVSTVFLGLDHGMPFTRGGLPGYQPVLWETKVFGAEDGEATWRYRAASAARRAHSQIVEHLSSTGGRISEDFRLELESGPGTTQED